MNEGEKNKRNATNVLGGGGGGGGEWGFGNFL